MKKLMIAIVLLFMACGGDEANVSPQTFIQDFGTNSLFFNNDGCRTKIIVSDNGTSLIYTLHKQSGAIMNLYGIDREVRKDVGIFYTTDNFELVQYFDDRTIEMKYDDVDCKIYGYQY